MKKRIIIGATIVASLIIFILIMGMSTLLFGSMMSRSFSGTTSQFGDMAEMNYVKKSVGGISGSSAPSGMMPEYDSDGMRTMPSPNAPTVYFQNYGTNLFVDTEYDKLSTFGLDVDTASYTIAKNYINNGMLPLTDAIRMEEFVNFFDYNYPQSGKFSIYTEVAPSPYENDLHYMQVGIKSRDMERKPVILTFVVDVSGSMNTENRLELVKKSLLFLVEQLKPQDTVGIVIYEQDASILLEHTTNKELIIDAINSLSTGGSTNAEAGLNLGYSQADKYFDSDKVNRVLLLSDGVANVGRTDSQGILSQLIIYKEKGIAMTAVGVGLGNYNDKLLEQIADKADGNYWYMNDFTEGKRIFSKQLDSTIQVAAYDAKVQVEFNPEVVKRYRLVGYENRAIADESFREAGVDAGEIGVGHEVTAIYELELTSQGEIGTVYYRYTDVDTVQEKEIKKDVMTSAIGFSQSTHRFKKAVAVARFSQILKMVQPPPSIDQVHEILLGLDLSKEYEIDFIGVIEKTQNLIQIRQGE